MVWTMIWKIHFIGVEVTCDPKVFKVAIISALVWVYKRHGRDPESLEAGKPYLSRKVEKADFEIN